MHRSGTSLVTKLLNLSGLYLGGEHDMLPANPTNPDGHWEHERIVEINDELLAEYGGGWDYPPDLSNLSDRRRTARLEEKARAVLASFVDFDPWGWKDPRNSLTLPFWRPMVGAMRVVVCVRNPLEVALSLRRRNGSSIAFGLSLWAAYNEALMRATDPAERAVAHYATILADPVALIGRVGEQIGLRLSDGQAALVSQSIKSELRHNHFTLADLVQANVSPRVIRLYDLLCAEAGWRDGNDQTDPWPAHAAGPTDDDRDGAGVDAPVGRFDYAAMEELRRRDE